MHIDNTKTNIYDQSNPWTIRTFEPHTSLLAPYYNEKPFKVGFVIGRFQTIHLGHEKMINKALELCSRVIVLVGSAQEEGTLRNPYSYETRADLINEIYENKPVSVSFIDDMTHENDHSHEWGRYLLNRVSQVATDLGLPDPEVMIYGNDEERSLWFDPSDIENLNHVIIGRSDLSISATKNRDFMVRDNYWKWKQNTNPKIHEHFKELRQALLEIPEYKEMLK